MMFHLFGKSYIMLYCVQFWLSMISQAGIKKVWWHYSNWTLVVCSQMVGLDLCWCYYPCVRTELES